MLFVGLFLYPLLGDYRKVFGLLPAEKKPDMLLNPTHQFIPKQSAETIIVYHPQAMYYCVNESHVMLLMR
jgi:cobalamin-dependent methionine synthase I